MDKEAIQKEIEEKFNTMMDAEGQFFKNIEQLRAITKDWEPKDDEQAETMLGLAQQIDSRVQFAIRQMLIRYGNLLFL